MIPNESELALLRGDQHHSRHYASFLKPLTLWSARVNNGAIVRGATTIAFDSGSGLAWSQVEALQTLWIGTAAGLGDIGKVRLRAVSSGTGGVSGSLTVAANSLLWADNLYLTFKHNYELDARFPYIVPETEEFLKDRDISWVGQTEADKIEPVCVVDIYNQADFIRNGELYFFFSMARSYPMAEGATLVDYDCAIYPISGVAITIDSATGIGRIRVTDESIEYYWVKFTVTDSLGNTQSNYQCLFAHASQQDSPTYPHYSFTLNQVSRAWDRGGCYAQLLLTNDASLEDIPDETFCIIWRLSSYGAAQSEQLVKVQVGNLTFVNPSLSFTLMGGPVTAPVSAIFASGVLQDGLPAPDGTEVPLLLTSTGAAVPGEVTAIVTDGMISTPIVASGAPYGVPAGADVELSTDGTILARAEYGDTYYPGGYMSGPAATASYPSRLWVYPQRFITGYVRKDNLVNNLARGDNQDTIEITSIEDLLRNHFMYSISLAGRPEPATWYEYACSEAFPLTVGKAIHHIFKWHSTLLEVCSVVGLDRNTDGRAYAEFEDGSLYTMPDQLARQAGIRAHLACSPDGILNLTEDTQLLTDAERAALPIKLELLKEDMSSELALLRQTEPRVALVFAAGIAFGGNFIPAETIGEPDPKPEVFPYCSMAPGQIPGRAGEGVVNVEREVIRSQEHLNEIAGRIFAQANNPYPEFRVRFHGDYDALLDPALPEWWQADIAAGDSLREIALPDLKLILRSVSTMFNQGHVFSEAVFEPEAEGYPGVPGNCMDTLPEAGGIIPPVINDNLPGALVTGSSVYYLPPGTSAWDLRTADAVSFLYADPWWRFKQATNASSSAILIRGGIGYLSRSTDAGDTWEDITPGAGPGGGPDIADLNFFEGEGSYLTQDFHIIGVRSADSGDWESWLYITDDDFATGSWVAIGEEGEAEIIASEVTGVLAENAVLNVNACWLRDSIYLVNCVLDSGSPLILIDMSTGSAVVLDFINSPYTDPAAFPSAGQMARIGSTRALTVVHGNYASNDHILAYVIDTADDLITIGPPELVEDSDSILSSSLILMDDTTNSFAWLYGRNFGGLTLRTMQVDESGAISVGAAEVVDTGLFLNISITRRTDNTILASYAKYDDGDIAYYLYVQKITLTPFSASTAVLVGETTEELLQFASEPRLVRATPTSDYYLLAWIDQNLDVQFATIDGEAGADPAIEDTVAGPTNRTRVSIARLADEKFIAIYGEVDGEEVYCRTLSVAGSVITDNNDETLLSGAADSYEVFDTVATELNGAMVGFAGVGRYLRAYYVSVPEISGADVKALGLSIGKGLGEIVYVTVWAGSQLRLKSYLLPAGTDDGVVLLGAATEAQVNSGERVVYPLAGWGDDLRFFLYGRFQAPDDLANPAALVYSPDYGIAWQLVEGDFDASHIGALAEFPGGRLVAIRNLVNQSKIYYGDLEGLALKSTLPFAARVNPRALAADYYDGTVVACSAAGLTIMVALSGPPYTTWTDITANHGTASGVRSVAIL